MENVLIIAAVVALAILVMFSAFFSASETSFTSANKIKLKNMTKDEKNKRADNALKLIDNYEKLLTTILVGNNLVNILASSICTWLFIAFCGDIGTIYATIFMLIVILAVGEITPKTLAKKNPEKYALKFAYPLSILVKIFTPMSLLFTKFTSTISSDEDTSVQTLTEDELVVMIDEIEGEGTLEEAESKLIKSAIQFDDKLVSEIITPRVDIVGVEKGTTMEELKEVFLKSGFSRIPVYEETMDRILGVVYAKDFYVRYFSNVNTRMTELMRPVKFVPETATVAQTFDEIQKSMTQMVVVVDSYGGTVGIVSLEDILEELVGEIWDESDEVQYPIIRSEDGTFAVLGEANLDDVMEEIGRTFDIGEYTDHTVGGYIQYILNRVPIKGDRVENESVAMIVRAVKNRRVKLVHITVKPVPEENQ